jgi:radical SAM superfamily enzyme YgiQ (UPF0313 family)
MMTKRVVLVYPQYVSGWQVQTRLATPLGLVHVGTPLSHAGYDVKIIDQRIDENWRTTLAGELEQDPICVGVSSMTGPQIQFALEISEFARRHGSAPVVWGGVHPSLMPEQTLENENIDIVVQGEGEETFLELVQALEGRQPLSSVRGIWYEENGGVRSTGARPFVDLNALPPLSFDLLDMDRYRRILFGVPHQNFITSRGCPRHCTFCYNTAFNRKRWRAMDPDLVVERIKAFADRYKVKGLIINESNFFVDMDRGRRILKGIIDANLDLGISKVNIDMNTLARMGPEDFDLLERAGCRRLPIALESGSEKIRTLIKKPVDADLILRINRDFAQRSMVPDFLFMIGFPTETREDLRESVSLAFKLVEENPRAGIYFNNYTPFPGTELFDTVVEHGLRVPKRLEDWVAFNYRNLIQGGPWLSKEMRGIVKMMDFCSFFIGDRPLLNPTEETSLAATLLGRIYAPLARKRAKSLYYRFPLEINLARFFRIYGKQD